jgi:NAD(P)-dependent dehydrogenase (short-subunit alcohol dehydrogenase family)
VAALTRAVAIDHVRDGIRVNCVAPGSVETPYWTDIFAKSNDVAALRKNLEQRHPMERPGTP